MGVWSLGGEDPLEKGMATHSSILAWRISWTGEPGGYSSWGFKESAMTEHIHTTNARLSRYTCSRLRMKTQKTLQLVTYLRPYRHECYRLHLKLVTSQI